ncbi:hypothetical protein L1987_59917 [Smallanthus sonchifolius]|uniref:Uncharacterized protein n=1 Tax=Smallanthus sonchifolius TaxID=185202 RepID=A0ACB9D6N5_9ASTR|nr:hypothetical protein L1987_59917 [Smallanthus sonchifolius]
MTRSSLHTSDSVTLCSNGYEGAMVAVEIKTIWQRFRSSFICQWIWRKVPDVLAVSKNPKTTQCKGKMVQGPAPSIDSIFFLNSKAERRNLGVTNGVGIDNLLTKRQKEAIDMQNGDAISSSQNDEHASVILLGSGIPIKSSVPPINLPKVEKIPPYTTWIFLDSDSEEEMVAEENDKKEFVESEDNIICPAPNNITACCCGVVTFPGRPLKTGPSAIVYDLLAQRLSRNPSEIKERYGAPKCSKSEDADCTMNSFLDKDLEADQFTVSIVRQELVLFNCSIEDNIAYGFDGKASSSDIENVAVVYNANKLTKMVDQKKDLQNWLMSKQ